ncbi:biotin-dependent carboxyltransferase family protein [Bacillus infantis]|uniref:5-oxoprolinase subunit C family protein n=1 Tax=Bacillus infantis TaxID=324767 RepID=UPI001CD5518A|nr:biotin-dependent carboxyltransferase family protein [Bacillus infantis]MCA1038159.1 biotin-dependent carboxyltransferase family protein [Bacillus infantis]
MGIKVLKPGLMTTIQDAGRKGFQNIGVSPSGAMDLFSYTLANLAAGNFNNEAVLEITLIGPRLLFEKDSIFSFFGAETEAKLNGIIVQSGKPITAKKGDVLSFGRMKEGCRTYLAFHGGILVPAQMGSRSTYLKGGFGGLEGRTLENNDVLPIRQSTGRFSRSWALSPSLTSYLKHDKIRVMPGRQSDWFSPDAIKQFSEQEFTISADSDRMGYRLKGPSLTKAREIEMITEPVSSGTVQVPADGNPIILMAERQTTGGYPKIAQVLSADIPILAQKKPGDKIRFAAATLEEAQTAYMNRAKTIGYMTKIVKEKWEKEVRLNEEN